MPAGAAVVLVCQARHFYISVLLSALPAGTQLFFSIPHPMEALGKVSCTLAGAEFPHNMLYHVSMFPFAALHDFKSSCEYVNIRLPMLDDPLSVVRRRRSSTSCAGHLLNCQGNSLLVDSSNSQVSVRSAWRFALYGRCATDQANAKYGETLHQLHQLHA